MNLEGWTILELHRQNDDPSIEGLGRTLSHLFATEGWMENPTQSGLFEFLALCWPHDSLKLLIHDAMQHWTPARREVFVALINNKLGGVTNAELIVETIDQIKPVDIDWLWEPYIPYGSLTFVEGNPGSGKTHLVLAIMASMAQGTSQSLPNQSGRVEISPLHAPMPSLYITQEDDAAAVTKPRIASLGVSEAQQSAIGILRGVTTNGSDNQPFSFAFLDALEGYVEDNSVRIVVIDPVTSYMDGVDIYRQNEVSVPLARLHLMAQRQGCAVLLVRHWVKAVGYSAKSRGMGSQGFAQWGRSILVVGDDPEDADVRIVAHAKNNYGSLGASLAFSLTNGIFAWCGVRDITANELALAKPPMRSGNVRNAQVAAAVAWLRQVVGQGDIQWDTLMMRGNDAGYPDKIITQAVDTIRGKEIDVWESSGYTFVSAKNRPEPAYKVD
ncbi:MAG: AAA family ATPase [Gammaproteobacteria bacterium]